jgi:hypothetical protein
VRKNSAPKDLKASFIAIPAHKIVLASRCQYFYSKFCREWADGKDLVAKFPEFSE